MILKMIYKYGLIGKALSHSLSPQLHNKLFKISTSYPATYDLIEIPPQNFDKQILNIITDFSGLNITIPYKQSIIKHIDNINSQDLIYNSINLIKKTNGSLIGYNTDVYGFYMTIIPHIRHIKNKNVLILGYGGSATSIVSLLLNPLNSHLTPKRLDIGVRSTSYINAKDKIYGLKIDTKKISIIDILNIQSKYNCIINATPVGMHPNVNQSPIDQSIVKSSSYVIDLIYNPKMTLLLKHANKYKILNNNGLKMLILQAIKSQSIWFDKPINLYQNNKILNKLESLLYNE